VRNQEYVVLNEVRFCLFQRLRKVSGQKKEIEQNLADGEKSVPMQINREAESSPASNMF
jgi:hypothetical protein